MTDSPLPAPWTAQDFIASVRELTGVAPETATDDAQWGDVALCRWSRLPRESHMQSMDCHFYAHHLGHPVDLAWRFGGGRLQTGRCVPGMSSFVPAGYDVFWRTPEEMRVVNLFIPSRLLARTEEALLEGRSASTEQHEAIGLTDPRAERLALLLTDSLVPGGPGDRLYAESLAMALCVQIVTHRRNLTPPETETRPARERLTPVQVRRAIAFMEEHLEDSITLRAIAAAVGVSEFHFARGFRRATGQSPHRFLTALRVTRAKALLADRKVSLSAVALVCGFGSASRFTTVFGREAGYTPGHYRRIVSG